VYHHIEGKLVECFPGMVVIEAGGVGYELAVPLPTFEAIRGRPSAKLYTRLVVRPESQRLFGFYSPDERKLFDLLTGVKGVGPSGALALLSLGSVGELCGAIAAGDVQKLKRAKRVGTRTAERIIVDLKEILREGHWAARDQGVSACDDSLQALVSLGYSEREASAGIAEARKSLGPDAPVEEIVKHVLRAS